MVHNFGRPALHLLYELPRSRGLAVYVRSGFGAERQKRFECNCCEIKIVKVRGERTNFYLFNLYCNPDHDTHIFYCLLSSMAAIQEADARASCTFMGDLNVQHSEWLGSATTTLQGIVAFDFCTISNCKQLITGPPHLADGTLDFVTAPTYLLLVICSVCSRLCTPLRERDARQSLPQKT